MNNKLWSKKLDPTCAKDALFLVADCLEELGLRYWLCFGTALGLYRDGGFIPWDDDIDLQVEDAIFQDTMYDVKELLLENGCEKVRAVKRPTNSKMSIFYKGIKVQIQGITETTDSPDMIQMLLFQYPRKYYYETCEGRNFTLPGPPEEYLKYCYGDDWNIPQNLEDWRDYMAPEQLKDAGWKRSWELHNKSRTRGKSE